MQSSAFESIRFGRFVFGSTCRSIRPGLSNRTAKDQLCFKRRTLTCAECTACIAPISFVAKSVNRGLPVLDKARALDLCRRSEGSWLWGRECGMRLHGLVFMSHYLPPDFFFYKAIYFYLYTPLTYVTCIILANTKDIIQLGERTKLIE